METNGINTEIIERYSDHNVADEEKNHIAWVKICGCLLLYGITIFIQMQMLFGTNLAGIVAQFQVMISTYLVIAVKKQGYWIAVSLNIIVSLIAVIRVWGYGNMNALPGVIVPICTIITISIISYYGKGLDVKLEETSMQKEELATLYEELAATEKELLIQNVQLMEYNDKMMKKEMRQSYFAYIDILTEIPNRKMIINKLDRLVELAGNKKLRFSVVFMDLNNFKRINTSKGYHIGDLLLKAIAEKIKGIIYEEDTLGRLGSDEFALIIQHDLTEAEICDYVESIKQALRETFIIEKMELNISASFGISHFPRDGRDSTALLNYADAEMCKAKEL